MKVSVITLHHVRNYGSLLQTYATQKTLEALGHEVEIVDFVPRGLTLRCGIATIRSGGNPLESAVRRCGAALVFTVEQLSMMRFLRKYITLTSRTYHSFGELTGEPPEADAYISGSDQVWNTQNANLPEDICAYYLAYAPEGLPRIAYASSIGKDAFDSTEEADAVKAHLKRYTAIGVRESHAVELLESIGIDNAVHIPDPTMAHDAGFWRSFCGPRKHKEPYILVYNLNRNSGIKDYARRLSKEKELPVVNFAHTLDFIPGARNRIHSTARDFINFLAYAEYVVTDSFHGTAFSINLGRPFVTFAAPRFNSRIESVLAHFGLSGRLLTETEAHLSVIDEPFDTDEIDRKLKAGREKSLKFLKTALGS